MLVRSPTFTNRRSSVTVTGSRPDSRSAGARLGRRPRRPCPRRPPAIAAMWAGVVPQQPPTRLTKPAVGELRRGRRRSPRATRRTRRTRWAGRRSGSRRRTCRRRGRARRCRAASPCAPSAQLRPTSSGFTCRTEYQNASVTWPDSVRPEASVMVPEIITGQRRPRSSNSVSSAKIAALAFSVSKIVSTSSTSAPPSTSPSACSR